LLAHESAHVMRRDPLRLSLLRFPALVLFEGEGRR
jgi:Zn-dependent protease with chaperone function